MRNEISFAPISSALEENIIRSKLSDGNRGLLRNLTLLDEVDSTNLALQRLARDSQHAHAVIADRQTAGRGRRGRSWHSPSGCNIYLSLGWRFSVPPAALTQLPLAAAVATARALQRAGVRGCGIKWPNDLLVGGRKLAGILVELHRAGEHEAFAVIGVGVNLGMTAGPEAQEAITQAWTEMLAHMEEPVAPDIRSRVCGLLVDEFLAAAQRFSESGFKTFAEDWSELDLLRGREVRLDTGREVFLGVAVGISDRGGLLLASKTPAGVGYVQEFTAGEASVRLFNS